MPCCSMTLSSVGGSSRSPRRGRMYLGITHLGDAEEAEVVTVVEAEVVTVVEAGVVTVVM